MKKVIDKSGGREVLTTMSDTIIKTFNDFDVSVELVEAIEGLRFYYFSFKALKSVRMKTVKSFEDDLRYALATDKLEIEAPIPDKQLIGVTVPKKVNQQMFLWKDAIRSKHIPTSGLTVPLGVDDYGEECFLDITTMPHLLIGGATGSGKSVFIHSVINSLVQALGPNELRLILIDTKQAELNLYEGLPHLMVPPIHEANRALRALKWVMNEIERRFDVLREGKFQNIASYHQGRRKKDEGLPYVVVIIDEIADAMQAYPNELESMLVRLAQMGRGVGIHMIISTQRPSVKVIS